MKWYLSIIWLLAIVLMIGGIGIVTQGQESTDTAIDFTGTVEGVGADILIVSGLQVDVSGLSDETVNTIHVGSTVSISGTIQNATITATTIVIINNPAPEATEEPTPEATAEVTPEMTAEPEATAEVTPEPTDDDDDDIIVIEGPVESIGINVITIFGIDIEVDPNDPILTEIEIGEVVRIEGIGDFEDGVLVVVSINITIVNVVIIDGGSTGGTGSGGNPPPQQPPPSSNRFNKDACKNGGWQGLSRADGSGFKNQGDCIQYANTGK